MWPWKKANTKNIEKDIILKGFPASIRKEASAAFDIIPLDHNVQYRFGQVIKVDNLIHPDKQAITMDGEVLEIPTRVYFNEPSTHKESKLNETQRAIVNCIYLQHHNGLVRQKRLELLIGRSDPFVIPYKFHLLGEYVVEILQDLQKHITTDHIDNFAKFAFENPKYLVLVESKMASFWNVHYRWNCPGLKNYIGRQNIDIIKSRMHEIASLKSRLGMAQDPGRISNL